MIVIQNGRIFIDGVETINAELIGLSMLDFAESIQKDNFTIELKDEDVFDSPVPIEQIICSRVSPEDGNSFQK